MGRDELDLQGLRRDEVRHAKLWLILALCVLGSFSIPRVGSAFLVGLLGAAFWVALLLYLGSAAELRKSLPFFLPLVPLYYFLCNDTFTWGALDFEPPFFGTDGQRFLRFGRLWQVEDRHLGWFLFLFHQHPAEAVGRWLGVDGLGRALLHWEMAFLGALAAALVFFLLRADVASTIHRLLIAYFFALSLAVWALASAVDTYIVSVFLLLVFLLEARRYYSGESRRPIVLGLVTGLFVSISLENLYAPLLFVALHPILKRPERWRGLLSYGSVAAGLYLAFVAALHLHPGIVEARSAGGLFRFLQDHTSIARLFSWSNLVRVGFHESIGSILAQPSLSILSYSWTLPTSIHWTTVVYVALLVALAATVASAWKARDLVRHSPFTWMLAGLLVVRHVFMTIFATYENVPFCLPSIAAFALLIGAGARALQGQRRRLLALGATLLALDLLLLVVNGSYLFHQTRDCYARSG